MAKDVVMPVLGMSQDHGVLLSWLKAEGDLVTKGEILMEVETDKAVVEVEAMATGTLSGVRAKEGDEIPTGQVMAVLLEDGESDVQQEASQTPLSSTSTLVQPEPIQESTQKPQQEAQQEPVQKTIVSSSTIAQQGKVLASPKARRLASEQQVDIALLVGSGPMGAIVASDIINYERPSLVATTELTEIALRSTETIIPTNAANIAVAITGHLQTEIRLDALETFRDWAQKRSSIEITLSDIVTKFLTAVLKNVDQIKDQPLNVVFPHAKQKLNPVIKDVQNLGLQAIATKRLELAEKLETGTLEVDDTSGANLSVIDMTDYKIDVIKTDLPAHYIGAFALGRIQNHAPSNQEKDGVDSSADDGFGKNSVSNSSNSKASISVNFSFNTAELDIFEAAQVMTDLVSVSEDPMDLIFLF